MTADQNEAPPSQTEYKTACGGMIVDPSRYPSAEYRGEKIFFCTQSCLNAFLLNPDPFMAGEVKHPLGED